VGDSGYSEHASHSRKRQMFLGNSVPCRVSAAVGAKKQKYCREHVLIRFNSCLGLGGLVRWC
jgi:hypothetical protein